MKKEPFSVTVNSGQYKFDLHPEEAKSLDLIPTGPNTFHLLHNGTSFHIELFEVDHDSRTYTLGIDGNRYVVGISDYYERLVQQLGLAAGGSQKINTIKAPMPGLVVSTLVQPGQAVQKGDPLLILEAMKMENVIKAAGEGMVKAVPVVKGQAVDKGQVLLELE